MSVEDPIFKFKRLLEAQEDNDMQDIITYYKENIENNFSRGAYVSCFKKILKLANSDFIYWYYYSYIENSELEEELDYFLNYVRSEHIGYHIFNKIYDINQLSPSKKIDKLNENCIKHLLVSGFHNLVLYMFSSSIFEDSGYSTFDMAKLLRIVIKYGNIDLVKLLDNSGILHMYRTYAEDETSSPSSSDEEDETLVYYLLDTNVVTRDVKRVEEIFKILVRGYSDVDYKSLGNDLATRREVIFLIPVPYIRDFFLEHYSHKLYGVDIGNLLVRLMFYDLEYESLLPFIDIQNLDNNTIISYLYNIRCNSEVGMSVFYNLFGKRLVSYDYFILIVNVLYMLRNNERLTFVRQNMEYLQQQYPTIYNDNITIQNIIKYYNSNPLSEDLSMDELVELKPAFSPINDNHTLFKAVRLRLLEEYHISDVRDYMPYCEILNYLTETYPQHYKCIYVDEKSTDDEDIDFYYLLINEEPYIRKKFGELLANFLSTHRIYNKNQGNTSVSSNKEVDEKIECLICQDMIKDNGVRCCISESFINGHNYCEACLLKWLNEDCKSCPFCRNILF